MTLRTLTDSEVRTLYGNPDAFMLEDGSVSPVWEELTLAFCHLPAPLPLAWDRFKQVTRFRCHNLIAAPMERALARIFQHGEAWGTIGDFGGCYSWRPRRGSRSKLSMHCWGLAVDIDVADNPDHSAGQVHPFTIEAMAAEGFYWGGHFSGRDSDPMHFERGVAA